MMPKKQLPPEVDSILQDAVHAELYASNLYAHVSNQLQRLGLKGAAKHFRDESESERGHYQRHADYLNDRGSVALIPQIDQITDGIGTLSDAIELAYNTELGLQGDYAAWYQSVDPVTQQHLLQFLHIQRESVGEYGDLLARLEQAAGDPCAILLIDQELGA